MTLGQGVAGKSYGARYGDEVRGMSRGSLVIRLMGSGCARDASAYQRIALLMRATDTYLNSIKN
jgi:hypothetical protein